MNKGIILRKNGSRLEFVFNEDKSLIYDFKDNSFTSPSGNKIELGTAKAIFSKYGSKIDRDNSDMKYVKLLALVEGENGSSLTNLGTKISQLYKYVYVEKWILQGYNVSRFINDNLDKTLTKIDKKIKNIALQNNLPIHSISKYYGSSKLGVFLETFVERIGTMHVCNLGNNADILSHLLDENNYNPKSLANYICNIYEYEAMDISTIVIYLIDYVFMSKQMGVRNIEKYPRYLHTTHDIIVKNFNSFKKIYKDEVFEHIRRDDYGYSDGTYSILYPQTYKEIQREGQELKHCVASYVERVLDSKTHIVFMRENNCLDQPLVTVEIKDEKIVQYKGSYNRKLTQEELKFLTKYSTIKNLPII